MATTKKAPAKRAAPAKKATTKKAAPARKAAGQEGPRQEGTGEEGSGQEGRRPRRPPPRRHRRRRPRPRRPRPRRPRPRGHRRRRLRPRRLRPRRLPPSGPPPRGHRPSGPPRRRPSSRSERRHVRCDGEPSGSPSSRPGQRFRVSVSGFGRMARWTPICDDLEAEHEALDVLVRDLPDEAWDRPTPAEGWMVRDQISHLWFFDGTARLAVVDADAFAGQRQGAARSASTTGDDPSIAPGREVAPGAAPRIVARGSGRAARPRSGRRDPQGPHAVVRPGDGGALVRHGAADGDVGPRPGRRRRARRDPEPTDAAAARRPHRRPGASVRLRHPRHGRYPSGRCASSSPRPTARRGRGDRGRRPIAVRGDALDFCLVVTQRRHPADTALVVEGPAAEEWMGIAQAFAGPPGPGRQPGQFAS